MNELENYINDLKFDEIKQKVREVVSQLFDEKLKKFDYKSQISGLLLGEVQSGKTRQMFGVISAAIDKKFSDIFVILTTDNTRLQEQTFKRALDSFPSYCICGENDDLRFTANKMRNPVVIVIKKNTSVLKRWKNNLLNSKYLEGRTLFILDDEADAASLNTKINQQNISTINRNIRDIRKTSSSCIYLQVTATPQAVLLQMEYSEFKPSFVIYFTPGKNYIGGDFFFSKPEPYCIIETDETETKSVVNPDSEIDFWLNKAILNFLVVCANFKLTKYSDVCNFLIHPSVKISDHNVVADKIEKLLNDILQGITDNDNIIRKNINEEWLNLYSTKPDIKSFDDIFDCIKDILFNYEIKPYTMNSKSRIMNFETGFNIIIGGNILGRGVTFTNLQTIYYSRTAKVPQADTYWQHCRMFGYDRDRNLIRLFMPFSIFKMFQELNESQKVLTKQITTNGIENTNLIYQKNIKPTRGNVVSSENLSIITGGVNYFAAFPDNNNLDKLDELLLPYNNKNFVECDIDLIIKSISLIESEYIEDWDSKKYISAINAVKEKNNLKTAWLSVSTEHKIRKNTGTMLSPTDRKEIDSFKDKISLIMYRMAEDISLGWNGKPVWMPNIKLPEGFVFYKVE